MSYSSELKLFGENNIYNSPKRFNKTFNILNSYKFIKSQKTPVIRITKNIKNNFLYNKRLLRQNYIKENYFYNHEKILTYHQNNILEKDKRCKTFNINKNKDIFKNLNALHKNMLKGKLLKSKLYKSIEKTANDNYIKKKRDREKNMFITMIEEDNLNENKNIFNFDPEFEENQKISTTNEESKYNIIQGKAKPTSLLKTSKYNIKDSDDYSSEKNIKKEKILSLNSNKNISIKNLKYEYNQNNIFSEKDINHNCNKDIIKKNKIKKKVSFSTQINDKKKEIDLNKLKPILLPCIKFNNSLNDYFQYILEGNINARHSLAKTCTAKLRFEIINKALFENYKMTIEQREFPIDLANVMFYYYIKEQKYFFEFDDLYKKYLIYLSTEIKNNNIELSLLLDKREKIFNENNIMIKKITDLTEELKIYESFRKLCLLVKHKKKHINDIPLEEIKKYGITLNMINPGQIIEKKSIDNNQNKKDEEDKEIKSLNKMRKSLNYFTIESKSKSKKISSVTKLENYSPEPKEPIFENADDFFHQFGEENENIYKKYKIYNNSFYEKLELESEVENENKIEQSPDTRYNKNLLKKLINEIYLLKQKNKQLNIYKKQLIEQRLKEQNYDGNISLYGTNNLININNENNSRVQYYLDENEETIALFKIYQKVREILLNPEINLEKILKMKKIYNIIKEKKTIKDIKFNGATYSKEVFHIKILELVYLQLIQWKKNCLKNKYLRKKYLIIKNEREKAMKIYKAHKVLLEEQIHLMKRNEIISNKTNKITVLQNKKVDPYYKKYLHDEIIKNEKILQYKINHTKIETEADKYYNLIQY